MLWLFVNGGQGNDATISSCDSIALAAGSSVGKKIRATASTDRSDPDFFWLQAGLHELGAGYFPEIKIVVALLKRLEGDRKFLAMVDKFSAAGTQ